MKTRDEAESKKSPTKRIRFVFEAPAFNAEGVPWQDHMEALTRFAERILGWRLVGKPEEVS